MSMDMDQAKQRLLELQTEYENRIEKIDRDLHKQSNELDQHWEDQAITTRQDDMRNNLRAEAQQGLQYVQQALSHIDNGTYGECDVCAEPIEAKRLQAVPYATLCMQHAEQAQA